MNVKVPKDYEHILSLSPSLSSIYYTTVYVESKVGHIKYIWKTNIYQHLFLNAHCYIHGLHWHLNIYKVTVFILIKRQSHKIHLLSMNIYAFCGQVHHSGHFLALIYCKIWTIWRHNSYKSIRHVTKLGRFFIHFLTVFLQQEAETRFSVSHPVTTLTGRFLGHITVDVVSEMQLHGKIFSANN